MARRGRQAIERRKVPLDIDGILAGHAEGLEPPPDPVVEYAGWSSADFSKPTAKPSAPPVPTSSDPYRAESGSKPFSRRGSNLETGQRQRGRSNGTTR